MRNFAPGLILKTLTDMDYKFEKAIIDVTLLRPCKDFGFVFGFEVKPIDGTPYHSGYLEANDRDTAAKVVYGAYLSDNLAKYRRNAYGF